MADEFEQARQRMSRDAAEGERDLVRREPGGAARDETQSDRDRLAIERAALRGQRSPAWQYAAPESPEATGSLAGFYTLLAIAVLVLSVLAGVYLTRRPNPQAAFTLDHAAAPMPPVASSVPPTLSPGAAPTAPPTASAPTDDAAPVAPSAPPPSAAPSMPLYTVPPASTPLPIAPGYAPGPAPADTGASSSVPPAYSAPPSDSGTPPTGTGTVAPDSGTAAPASSTPVAPTIGP